jgi:hypothetical protein
LTSWVVSPMEWDVYLNEKDRKLGYEKILT